MRFDYSVIRFVPDTMRGEFLNLAVVVGKQDEWSVRRVEIQDGRAKALHGGKTLIKMANEAVDRIEEQLRVTSGEEEPAWLESVAGRHRGIVQFSSPAPLNAESLDQAAESLAAMFLTEAEHRRRGVTRGTARSELRRSLLDALPSGAVAFNPVLEAGQGQRTKVDFVVRNGAVRQLSHAFSFQGANVERRETDVKAWAWVIDTLKEEGGSLQIDGRRVDVPENVDIEVFVVPPESSEAIDYDHALATFDRLNVVVEHESERIAARAEDLLAVH